MSAFVKLVIGALVIAAIVANSKDVARYLKISSM